MQHNRRYIDSMRIIVLLFGFLFLTACSSLQAQQQNPHYSIFVKSVDIMADSMRENIYEMQELNAEAQFKERALKFVHGEKLQELPIKPLPVKITGRLKLLETMQVLASDLLLTATFSEDELARFAQGIYYSQKEKEAVQYQQEIHADLQEAIEAMIANEESLEPQEIVASINANERDILSMASKHKEISILELEHATRQHLQGQNQRKKLLTNWQNLKLLTREMEKAHETLMEKQKYPIKDFCEVALKLQGALLQKQKTPIKDFCKEEK